MKGKCAPFSVTVFLFVKVGEIFYCGKETEGSLKVLPAYLGTAISGFGGGSSQVYVIEEEESFLGGLRPVDPANDINRSAGGAKQNNQDLQFRNNTHDGSRPSGRKQQTLVH